ncbi:hypothetical protein E4O00_07940 [Treponema sp. OMZ 788]|uniref:hypothetical protein n=1 Tax=unclassified Treponema TaxID=2638727 RepID=UPI0020A4B1CD|nr:MULTISPECIES: hypothetical protein [unclassified Treponema]UTC63333.1 hypothetical protein E4O05_05460 [Treponema sp. OMZ 787]UTC63847.1 hypothetical protein E4O00_07940 [Treponema sp. OMZ 788]
MGVLDTINDVVTLGASSRVNSAKKRYESAVNEFNRSSDRLRSRINNVESLSEEISVFITWARRNQNKIHKLLKTKSLSNKERNILEQTNNMPNLVFHKSNKIVAECFDGSDSFDTFSEILATILMPMGTGIIAANAKADEVINKIEKETNKVTNKLNSLNVKVAEATKIEQDLRTKLLAYKAAKNIIENL